MAKRQYHPEYGDPDILPPAQYAVFDYMLQTYYASGQTEFRVTEIAEGVNMQAPNVIRTLKRLKEKLPTCFDKVGVTWVLHP